MYRLSRDADFARLWTGGAVSALGSSLTTLAYPLLALSLTPSAGLAGLVGLVSLAAGALTRLPAGVLVDRLPLRRVLVTGDLVRAAITLGAAMALLTGHLTLPLLMITATGHACAAVFGDTAHSVALRYVVPAAQLPRAFALLDGRGHAVGLVGQPTGGYLFGLAPVLPLLADTVSFLVSARCSASIRNALGGRGPAAGPRSGLRQDLVTGLRFLLGDPFLRAMLVAAAGYQLVFTGTTFVLVAELTARGVSPGRLGGLFAVAAVGGILGAITAPLLQRRLAPHRLVVLMGGVATAVFAAFGPLLDGPMLNGAGDRPLLAGALLGGVYLTTAPANAMLSAAQVRRTPAVLQGRVMAASYLVAGLVAPAGPPLAGALLDLAGPRTACLLIAGLTGLLTLGVQLNPAMRRMVT